MGGVVNAVTAPVKAVADIVSAPVKAVTGIASGQNVGSALATAGSQIVNAPVKAAESTAEGVKSVPGVGQSVDSLTAGGLTNTANLSHDVTAVIRGESAGRNIIQDATSFGKSAAIVGAGIATGGAFGAGTAGSIGYGLAGSKLAGGLFSGNVGGAFGGAASLIPYNAFDDSGLVDALKQAQGIYNDIQPIGGNAKPFNLGPYAPSFTDPGAFGSANSVGSDLGVQLAVLAAGALIIYFLAKGRKKV